ncbi:MAG: rhodanese-like protein [Gammaproteobacteria bacterium]|jgi:rhodanese-related sulfurtransferase|nr:rhodanese-like protein [Gammaproteobacteria bacterium]
MQEYINFFQQHLLLSSAFVIILLLLIANEIRYRLSGIAKLSPRQVTQALNHEIAILIDTRARNDYQRSHILGAMNIVESELLTELKRLEKYKDKQIIIIDAAGQKAHNIALKLKKQGFDNVAMLSGGMQAWLAEGLPIAK